jgi:hypothetical protein
VRELQTFLLSDATMPVNFCKAGAHYGLKLLEHFGDRLFVVEDVFEELERHAETSAAVRRLVEEWPSGQVRSLEVDLSAQVASILSIRHVAGDHPETDLGEVATVLFAARSRDAGTGEYVVVTDDNYGKELARDRGLDLRTTPQTIVELVCAGTLTFDDGDRVWRQCFTNRSRWAGYRDALARECPKMLA